MNARAIHKYRPYAPVGLTDRSWPNKIIDRAPIWCSVALRDGNQALVDPVDGPRKRRLFDPLVPLGLKHIQVGFPAASDTELHFVRELLANTLTPHYAPLQFLTPTPKN